MDVSWTWVFTKKCCWHIMVPLLSRIPSSKQTHSLISPPLLGFADGLYSALPSFTNRKHSLYLTFFYVCGNSKSKLSHCCNQGPKVLKSHQELSCMRWPCTSSQGFSWLFSSCFSIKSFKGQSACVMRLDILQQEKGTHYYLLHNSLSRIHYNLG